MTRSSGTIVSRQDVAPFSRVVAVVIGIETYCGVGGNRPADVAFARADAEAFAATLEKIYPEVEVDLALLVDGNATLTQLKETLRDKIKTLSDEDLFVLYFAGHGFHGEGRNRLSAWDTNPRNISGTTLSLHDALLEPLSRSACPQALVFIDVCAAGFRDLAAAGDVITDLEVAEIEEFLDSAWYCGVFLSCSPGEKSYPSKKLGHGVWTAFLLRALRGQAKEALEKDRWLTDRGLRDWLKREVPRYITRELPIADTQTPQAVISASNSFRIRHMPEPKVTAHNELSALPLKIRNEYLEGVETGAIRQLDGFSKRVHDVPDRLADSANRWIHRLLQDRVTRELQSIYNKSKEALALKRRDMRLEAEDGQGDLHTPIFRYSIETKQNPEDCTEYAIVRRLALRSGWNDHRAAISSIFSKEFECVVVEFETSVLDYDEFVDKLENVKLAAGGSLEEDINAKRVTYTAPDGAQFAVDLGEGRLEMSFGRRRCLEIIEIIDAARDYQLDLTGRSSVMLTSPQV